MPPGALLKVISFALYKHVCITFQPTLVDTYCACSYLIKHHAMKMNEGVEV
jgi:hypothetical protein